MCALKSTCVCVSLYTHRPLPEGDVLVHCGDFAPDRLASKRRGPGTSDGTDPNFAAWVLGQPHAFKVVVRGNHDPTRLPLAAPNALCVRRLTPSTSCHLLLGHPLVLSFFFKATRRPRCR
jgi:hypothetical protein